MNHPLRISITAISENPADHHRADQLAQRLQLPRESSCDDASVDFWLVVTGERLELRDNAALNRRGVSSVFILSGGKLGRRQPLAKAIGRHARTVIDATAGLGHDAFLLAGLGYRITAVERCPVIAALLEDGIHRGQCSVTLICDDARKVLAGVNPAPDVVYLDPMFPPKRKHSALAKKNIQMLRKLVGDDLDAVELFEIAMKTAVDRVVVKRPTHAPPLQPEPTMQFHGKLARYDVYKVLTPPSLLASSH